MKKYLLGLIMMALVVLSACQPAEEVIEPEPEPITDPTDQVPTGQSYNFVKSELARVTDPGVDEDQIRTLAENQTAFALSLYEQIRSEDGNIIFSPFSIALALSMAAAGAESSTEQAMLDALKIQLPAEDLHPAYNALLLAIEQSQEQAPDGMEGNRFQLNIANSIWGQADYAFKQSFLDVLAQQYGAGIFAVDFIQNFEGARLAINDWVSEETEQKIKDLIPQGAIDSLTRLVLANAVYFNASWMNPFNESLTAKAPFTTLEDTEITVDMMKLNGENFIYGQDENYQALELPYLSGDFVMTLLVPEPGKFSDFEAQLNQEKFTQILSSMSYTRVNLEMPKFDFDSDINANEPLIALGMGEAFDPELADFSGITDLEDLMITDVLHKATITVDEQGTEAAAATAVIVGVTSAMPEEPITLVIDRPFLFMIRHQPTNTILFMGRVAQP